MRIEKVTITGADDKVDPYKLYDLSDRYPFVEWGILYYPDKMGTPRFPSCSWMYRFDKYAPSFVEKSIHLCGGSATTFCGGDLSIMRNSVFHTPNYNRIQVNIHPACINQNEAAIADLFTRSGNVVNTIIQANEITTNIILEILKSRKSTGGIQVLFDESRGKGKENDFKNIQQRNEHILEKFRCGFAGGIDENNIRGVVDNIQKIDNTHYNVQSILTREVIHPPSAWIDLESGARTNNEFDLNKVERILKIMKGVII